MRITEILRLVWINVTQNKFKVLLTSIGIVAGAATIVMVIAIGLGGKAEVAEEFKNLNAGAIDISYERAESTKGFDRQNANKMQGANGGQMIPQMPLGTNSGGERPQMPSGENGGGERPQIPSDDMKAMFDEQKNNRTNTEDIVLSEDDVSDLETFLTGISDVTISFNSKSDVEGGELDEAVNYTIAGVKENYAVMSNLTMSLGDFISNEDDKNKDKVCVLGYSVAKEIFGDTVSAYDSTIYIDGRAYVVNGILSEVGSVASGISPDTSIFIPYNTGIKYISGNEFSPTITVIADDVDNVDSIINDIKTVLGESYTNAEFTISDAGSKMEAALKSNDTLTALLIAMAVIVFIVGGIGIMNILFVSVKERTKEIGILKAIGCTKSDILTEFLMEACAISLIGGIIGVLLSFGIAPIVTNFGVRVELSAVGAILAIVFAFITGSVFGFYPALKASSLIPVEALNEE